MNVSFERNFSNIVLMLNIRDWNEAAATKGCEQMSHSCNSSSFDCNCVINAWGNETI